MTDTAFGETVELVEDEPQVEAVPETRVEAHEHEMLEKELPLRYVLKYLHNSRTAKQLYRDLCIYIPFVIWFTFFAYYRRNSIDGHYMSSALAGALSRQEIPPTPYDEPLNGTRNIGPHFSKTFDGLDNPDDWHRWFEGVVIPVFFNSLDPATRAAKGSPLGMNLNVGAMRVRQHRVKDSSCSVNDDLYPVNYSRNCWDEFSTSSDKLRTEPIPYNSNGSLTFKYTDGCRYTGQAVAGQWRRYPCGGFIVDFPMNMTFAEALAQAIMLRTEGFVDHRSTRFIVIEFFTYNPALDMFASGRMFHEVTASGGWIPTARFKSFTAWNNTKFPDGILAFEFLFFIFVLFYTIRLIVRWVRSARKTGKPFRFIFTFWNFLEFCNLCLFFVSFALHWEWWRRSVKELDVKLPDADLEYPETLNYLMELYYQELYVLAINTVLTYMIIMKYFEMNQRLNILTRTLEASAQSVVGVLVIFLLIVTSYALAGMVLYGHAVADYRNMSSAFATLFLTLMGSFDYDVLRTENRGWTFMYFWTFIVLALFIMLNFITAVIGQGFEEEHAKTKVVPLEAQLRRLAFSMRRFSLKERCNQFVAAVVLRTRRLPDDVLEDHLQELRRSLLAADKISEEAIDDGEVDEPDYVIQRATLDEVLPEADLRAIGAEFLDNLYMEMAEDFDVFGDGDEEDEDEAKIAQAFERGMQEGFIDVFVNGKEDIARSQQQYLGGVAEEDRGQTVVDGRRQSFRRRVSSAASQASSSRHSTGTGSGSETGAVERLSRYELLDKLLSGSGAVADDAKARRKREVVDELIGRGGSSAAVLSAEGIASLRRRVNECESAVEGAHHLLTLISHKLVKVAEQRKA